MIDHAIAPSRQATDADESIELAAVRRVCERFGWLSCFAIAGGESGAGGNGHWDAAVPRMPEKNDQESEMTKLQMWVMAALWAVCFAGGSAWAHYVTTRIDSIEQFQRVEFDDRLRAAVQAHENRPHRDAIHVREFNHLEQRLARIEEKIDAALKK